MSSRVLNSRYSRRRGGDRTSEGTRPIAASAAAASAAAASQEEAAATAAARSAAAAAKAEPETINIRFGFATLHGKTTVIEVSEEVWGNKRYYVAALSEDPSICVKALELREALFVLFRHLKHSPTIKRYFFDQPPSHRQQRRLQSLIFGH
jgi:hypothetical protein